MKILIVIPVCALALACVPQPEQGIAGDPAGVQCPNQYHLTRVACENGGITFNYDGPIDASRHWPNINCTGTWNGSGTYHAVWTDGDTMYINSSPFKFPGAVLESQGSFEAPVQFSAGISQTLSDGKSNAFNLNGCHVGAKLEMQIKFRAQQ